MRGIAAILVAFRHGPAFFPAWTTFPESYLAVDFFFCLSGFVLAHAYGDKLQHGMTPSRFMAIRLLRLYPLYFLALLLAAPLISYDIWAGKIAFISTAIAVLPSIFFLPSPFTVGLFPLNGAAWSLFFELFANLIFCFVGRLRMLSPIFALVMIAAGTLIYAVVHRRLGFGHSGYGPMADGFDWPGFYTGMARVMFSFFAGVFAFRIWNRWRHKLSIHPLLSMLILSSILMSMPRESYRVTFDLLAAVVGFPCLIMLSAGAKTSGSGERALLFLGRISYAIYILSWPVSVDTQRIVAAVIRNAIQPWWVGASYLTILIALAISADVGFDTPIRARLTRRLMPDRGRALRSNNAN